MIVILALFIGGRLRWDDEVSPGFFKVECTVEFLLSSDRSSRRHTITEADIGPWTTLCISPNPLS